MTKNDFEMMERKLKNYNFTQKDYEVLQNLILYCPPQLFISFIDLVINNSNNSENAIQFKDLEVDSQAFSDIINDNIKFQSELSNKVKVFKKFQDEKNRSDYQNVYSIDKIDKEEYIQKIKEIKENIIFGSGLSYEQTLEKLLSQQKLMNALINNEGNNSLDFNIQNVLLSSSDFMISTDYNSILLDKYDLEYAYKNNISESDMKKMKSLYYKLLINNNK